MQPMNTNLVLASGSPRRSELLTQLGYQFECVTPNIPEQQAVQESAQDYVLRLASQKAQAGLQLLSSANDTLVLGADTVVVKDQQVLEKPTDFADAERMLSMLSGGEHQVFTAVSVTRRSPQIGIESKSLLVTTKVWFRKLSQLDIERYWQTGEPQDKAGSYGIQGIGGKFVSRIDGSYSAVVGLPLCETEQLLQQFLHRN